MKVKFMITPGINLRTLGDMEVSKGSDMFIFQIDCPIGNRQYPALAMTGGSGLLRTQEKTILEPPDLTSAQVPDSVLYFFK